MNSRSQLGKGCCAVRAFFQTSWRGVFGNKRNGVKWTLIHDIGSFQNPHASFPSFIPVAYPFDWLDRPDGTRHGENLR